MRHTHTRTHTRVEGGGDVCMLGTGQKDGGRGLCPSQWRGHTVDLCVIHWKKQLMFPGHNRVNPGLFLAPCGLGGLHIVSSVGHPVCHIKKTITWITLSAVYSIWVICCKSGNKKPKEPRCLIGWRVEGKSVWLALSNRRGLKLLVCNYYKAYVSRYPPISRLDGAAEGCAARRAVCALGQAWRDPGTGTSSSWVSATTLTHQHAHPGRQGCLRSR